MPHYADGTPATPGDTVRGKGYNIKDPETGELAEITGTLLHVNPNADACNVQVAVVEIDNVPESSDPFAFAQANAGVQLLPDSRYAKLRVEYGQADHFLKV